MEKHDVFIGTIILFICIGLTGCTENKKTDSTSEMEKFIGAWTFDENNAYTFYANGTFTHGNYVSGSFTLTDGKILFNTTDNTPGTYPENQHFTAVFDYVFSEDAQSLTFTVPGMGMSQRYTKQ
jgi:hypothetical protein